MVFSGSLMCFYQYGLRVCNNNLSILNGDNDHVCPHTFLHWANQYQCIPLPQLPKAYNRDHIRKLDLNLAVKSCNISFRHSLRILINWVTHMITKVPINRIFHVFQITSDHYFMRTKWIRWIGNVPWHSFFWFNLIGVSSQAPWPSREHKK